MEVQIFWRVQNIVNWVLCHLCGIPTHRLHMAYASVTVDHCPSPQPSYLHLCFSTSLLCHDGFYLKTPPIHVDLLANHERITRLPVLAPNFSLEDRMTLPIGANDILA